MKEIKSVVELNGWTVEYMRCFPPDASEPKKARIEFDTIKGEERATFFTYDEALGQAIWKACRRLVERKDDKGRVIHTSYAVEPINEVTK